MRKRTTEKYTQYQNFFRSNFTKTSIMNAPVDGFKNFQNLKEELLNNVVSVKEASSVIGGSNNVHPDGNNSRGIGDIIPQ